MVSFHSIYGCSTPVRNVVLGFFCHVLQQVLEWFGLGQAGEPMLGLVRLAISLLYVHNACIKSEHLVVTCYYCTLYFIYSRPCRGDHTMKMCGHPDSSGYKNSAGQRKKWCSDCHSGSQWLLRSGSSSSSCSC